MNNIESSKGEIVMYQPDETIRLEVRMDEETVGLTQQQMAELFQKDQSVVARHINNWTFASEYSFIKRLIYTFDRVYGT